VAPSTGYHIHPFSAQRKAVALTFTGIFPSWFISCKPSTRYKAERLPRVGLSFAFNFSGSPPSSLLTKRKDYRV
jgi:hypothetical protein